MKIQKKIYRDGSMVFKFDNGVKVMIEDADFCTAGYEVTKDGDEDFYETGSLWFEGDVVTDFDGCYELPVEVIKALEELGLNTCEIKV